MESAPKPTVYRPWVETVAGRIHDPLKRLRFLQAAAPPLSDPQQARRGLIRRLMTRNPKLQLILLGLIGMALIGLAGMIIPAGSATALPPARPPIRMVAEAPLPEVWMVESSGVEETYSNGLRIDNRFSVAHHRRSYLAFPADRIGKPVRRHDPAGIVFHSTESHLAPFESGQNGQLRRIGESLLAYVQRKFAYHFLIDRFRRVFRVVAESDSADHAGASVWADGEWLYLNLNAGFLGVALEARTEPGQTESGASPAQLRSAAMLTEMLRCRYRIPAANCVTHAQVSVNPQNGMAGYHTDWASSFPFAQVGLPDNYAQALPAVWAFGFQAGPDFRAAAGVRMVEGIDVAEDALRSAAATDRSSPAAYRKRLQTWYRQRLGAN